MLHDNCNVPTSTYELAIAPTLLDRPFDSLTASEWECLKYRSLGGIFVEEILRYLEIDSLNDNVFGTIYRIWSGTKLLGSFNQESEHNWVAEPYGDKCNERFHSPEKAQLVILACEIANAHQLLNQA